MQSAVENSFSTYVLCALDGLFWLNLYITVCMVCFFQTIHDSGTYDELCHRQSITTESIFGDEFDADTATSDIDSPSDGHNSNPECETGSARPKISKRQQSVIQYMRDQLSMDDDPVAILSVSFIF